ncbi:MAG: hypothetical protein HYU66_04060, partial [Armatimonadetes bacterium]|nr:hypothetical protein [Armatimonadota bacterium]
MTRNTAARIACLLALTVVSPLLAGNDRPVVTLPTVEQGGQVKGSVPVDVVWKPADDGIAVVKLDLSIDDQPVITFDLQPRMRHVQYNWDTSTWTDGKHTVVVQVEDAQGRQRSYRTFVYVRNHELPAGARDTQGTRIDVEDLDGNPDSIITQRALIRVRVNPEMGAKWVVLLLNGQFIAMMNYPPYQFMLDPQKRHLKDGPYVVQAKVIQPDNSEVYPETVKVTLNVNGTITRIQPPVGVEPGGRAPGSEVAPAIVTPRPGGSLDQPGTADLLKIPMPDGAQPAPEPGRLNVDTGGRPVLPGGQPAVPATGPAPTVPGMVDSGRGQVIVPTVVRQGPLPPKGGPTATRTRIGPPLPPLAGAGQPLPQSVRDTMLPGHAGTYAGGAHLATPREQSRRGNPVTGAAAVGAAEVRSAGAAAVAAAVAAEGPATALPGRRRVTPQTSAGSAAAAREAGMVGVAAPAMAAASGRPSVGVPS